MLHQCCDAPVDVCTAAEHDFNTIACNRAREESGIGKGPMRDLESQKLIRLTAVDRGRHNAMLDGIKRRELAEKSTLLGIDAIVGTRIRIEIEVSIPLRRWIAHRILFKNDV